MIDLLERELSSQVVSALFEVHRGMGPGLLESVYEGALEVELTDRGLKVERQKQFKSFYKRRLVGEYFADMVVEGKIIIEVKSVLELNQAMKFQLLNYMRLARIRVGYLVNFRGARLDYTRLIL